MDRRPSFRTPGGGEPRSDDCFPVFVLFVSFVVQKNFMILKGKMGMNHKDHKGHEKGRKDAGS